MRGCTPGTVVAASGWNSNFHDVRIIQAETSDGSAGRADVRSRFTEAGQADSRGSGCRATLFVLLDETVSSGQTLSIVRSAIVTQWLLFGLTCFAILLLFRHSPGDDDDDSDSQSDRAW